MDSDVGKAGRGSIMVISEWDEVCRVFFLAIPLYKRSERSYLLFQILNDGRGFMVGNRKPVTGVGCCAGSNGKSC